MCSPANTDGERTPLEGNGDDGDRAGRTRGAEPKPVELERPEGA